MVHVQIGNSAVWFGSSRIDCPFINTTLLSESVYLHVTRAFHAHNQINYTSTFNAQCPDTSRLSEG